MFDFRGLTGAEQLDRYSPRVLDKAYDLKDSDRFERDEEHSTVFWVIDPKPYWRRYRVQVYDGGYSTCTCPNGGHRGGEPTCYHTAAALLVLEEEDHAAETRA